MLSCPWLFSFSLASLNGSLKQSRHQDSLCIDGDSFEVQNTTAQSNLAIETVFALCFNDLLYTM